MYAPQRNSKGFTLAELMITLAVSGMVAVGVWSTYRVQTRIMGSQEVVTDLQQNLRTAIFTMTRELRSAGFDPTGSGLFGITFVGVREDLDDNSVTDAVNAACLTGGVLASPFPRCDSSITFTADFDEDGVIDANETYTYELFQFGASLAGTGATGSVSDLGRATGGGLQPFVQNIEAMGLAYAYDANTDGALDTYTITSGANAGTQQVIWAVDSNFDGDPATFRLDTNLDNNGDGNITRLDGPTASATGVTNEIIGGAPIGSPGTLADIRAVRIWILAGEDAGEHSEYLDQNTYVVGRSISTPRDSRRRRLTETVVFCKNMGLR